LIRYAQGRARDRLSVATQNITFDEALRRYKLTAICFDGLPSGELPVGRARIRLVGTAR
jgi:hypothetical protein